MSERQGYSLRDDIDGRKRGGGYIQPEKIVTEHPEVTMTDLWPQVEELVSEGRIVATKTARTMYPGNPPLMDKYRIVSRRTEPFDTTGLNPRIAESDWVHHHPDDARRAGDFLERLSQALDGKLDLAGLDKREAGYELVLDEHAFDKSASNTSTNYNKILNDLGIDWSELGVITLRHPPTLEAYEHGDGTIVVSENATPYNRIRRIARDQEVARYAFGFVPSAVVLGNGGYAKDPGFITDVLEQASLPRGSRLLYWGDLDREGITILTSVSQATDVHVLVWPAPYHAMLESARCRAPRESRDKRNLMPDLSILEGSLSPSDRALAKRLLEGDFIVPQESVRPGLYVDGSLAWR